MKMHIPESYVQDTHELRNYNTFMYVEFRDSV